jgi:hypothetical protein
VRTKKCFCGLAECSTSEANFAKGQNAEFCFDLVEEKNPGGPESKERTLTVAG